jgi:hypothetical protein
MLIDLWNHFDGGEIAHVHCEACGANGPSIYSAQGTETAVRRARFAWGERAAGDRGPSRVVVSTSQPWRS